MVVLTMLPTIITVIFAIILFLFILPNILRGLSKGIVHMAIKTVFVFVSGILSVHISVPLGRLISGALVSKLGKLISGIWSGYDELIVASPSIEDLITGVPAVVISIVLYIVIFILLSLIMLIPARLIKKHLIEKFWPNIPKLPWAGALCGVLTGLATFVFVMAPVTGTLSMIGDVANVVNVAVSDEKEDGTLDVYEEVIEPVTGNFFVKFNSSLGGKVIFNSLTSFEVNGEKVSVSNEFAVLADAFSALEPVLDGGDPSSWTRDDINSIGTAADRLSDSKLVAGIFADILSNAGNKWSADEAFLGMKIPSVGSSGIDSFLKEFFVSFKGITRDTVSEDIGTLTDVLGILYDYGMLSSKEENSTVSDTISTEGFISDLLETVMKNERFRGTAAAIINLGMHDTLDILDVPATDSEAYDRFVADIADIINSSDDAETVKQDVYDSFTEHGIKIDKNITDRIAEFLEQDFAGRTDVSPEEVGQFFKIAFAVNENSAQEM